MRRDRRDDLEETYLSLLCGDNGASDDDNGSLDGTNSVDSEWEEESTLVEMMNPPYLNASSPILFLF